MSRTFHKTEYTNPGSITRRQQRISKRGPEMNLGRAGGPNDYSFDCVQSLIISIAQRSARFSHFLRECENDYKSWLHTNDTEKLASLMDDCKHPIYSRYTQDKMNKILMANPDLIHMYLGLEDPILRLTYNPTTPPKLTPEELENLTTKMWTMIYALLPPNEVLETKHMIRRYLEYILDNIRKIETIINICVARQIDL